MKVINRTNNCIIAEKTIIADNIFSRFKGLLGKNTLNTGEALLIKPCNSIHSFGMRFSFDAIFVDKNNQVKHIIKNMKPCRISPIVLSACLTLELPSGTAEKTGTKIGDYIDFIQ